MAQVFEVNKGINRPISFKGVKAQYILYLILSAVAAFILFTVLYLCGLNTYLCIGLVLPPAIVLITAIQRFSNKYGQYGMLKIGAHKKLPHRIKVYSSKVFHLKK